MISLACANRIIKNEIRQKKKLLKIELLIKNLGPRKLDDKQIRRILQKRN